MDNVLIALDKRLIIFLEDVDRNKSDEVFFNEIASLLDNLRQLNRVSFVLAIGQQYDAGEILIKTADHVENVPRLNRFDVINSLETFRSYCIKRCPDIVNTISKNYDKDRMGWNRSTMIQAVAEIDDYRLKLIDTISKLTDNPRVLKHALRKTLTDWEKLAGEIDFNDLLIVNVLKTVDERIFSFIDKNIGRLCTFVSNNDEKEQDEQKKILVSEFNRAKEKAVYNVDAVLVLLNALFPGFTDSNMMDWLQRQDLIGYQHIANDEPTKYWERVKRGELYENEISDCEILEVLNKWNEDFESKAFRDMEMVEALSNDDRVFPKALQFKKLISRVCLQKTASKQFGITLEKYGNKASSENCPAISQWFILTPDPVGLETEDWQNWFFEQIKISLPISLRYANDLYRFWVNPKFYRPSKLRSKIIEEAKLIYGDNPEILIKAIDPKFLGLSCFAIELSDESLGGSGFNPQEWQWLGDVLFKAMTINREIIIPQMVFLIGEIQQNPGQKSGQVYHYKFQEDIAKGIFGKNFKQLMKILAEDIDLSIYDNEIKNYVQLCQNYAKKWITDQGNGVEKN